MSKFVQLKRATFKFTRKNDYDDDSKFQSEEPDAFRAANLIRLEEFSWYSRGFTFIYHPNERLENIFIGDEFKIEKHGHLIDLVFIDLHSFCLLKDFSHVKKLIINHSWKSSRPRT